MSAHGHLIALSSQMKPYELGDTALRRCSIGRLVGPIFPVDDAPLLNTSTCTAAGAAFGAASADANPGVAATLPNAALRDAANRKLLQSANLPHVDYEHKAHTRASGHAPLRFQLVGHPMSCLVHI